MVTTKQFPRPANNDELVLARRALESGRCEDAIRFAAGAIAKDPQCAGAYFVTGQADLLLQRYAAAEAAFLRALKLGSPAAACHYGIGAGQAMQGHLSKALKSYALALRQPDCSDAMRQAAQYQLGLLQMQLGNADAALHFFEKAEAMPLPHPNLTASLFYRLKLNAQRGACEEALLCADQLLALHPEEWDYLRVKAQVLLQSGTPDALQQCGTILDGAEPLCTTPAARYERLYDTAQLALALAAQRPEEEPQQYDRADALLRRAAAVPGIGGEAAAECELAAIELLIQREALEPALQRAQVLAAAPVPEQHKARAAYLAAELLFHFDRGEQAADYLPLLQAAANSLLRSHGFYLAAVLARRADPQAPQTARAYHLAMAQFKKAMAEKDPSAAMYRIKLEADFGNFEQARLLLRTLPTDQVQELDAYITACETAKEETA